MRHTWSTSFAMATLAQEFAELNGARPADEPPEG